MIEQPPSPAPLREQKTLACALGVVWLLSALWATQYAWTRSPDLPLNNAAVWVRQSAGSHPVSARWSWAQYNEHRLPLVKLADVGAAWSTGDFRSPVMLSVLLMSGASIILLMPALARRGRRAWWDAGYVQPARVHPASRTPSILFLADDETFDPRKCVVLRHQSHSCRSARNDILFHRPRDLDAFRPGRPIRTLHDRTRDRSCRPR